MLRSELVAPPIHPPRAGNRERAPLAHERERCAPRDELKTPNEEQSAPTEARTAPREEQPRSRPLNPASGDAQPAVGEAPGGYWSLSERHARTGEPEDGEEQLTVGSILFSLGLLRAGAAGITVWMAGQPGLCPASDEAGCDSF